MAPSGPHNLTVLLWTPVTPIPSGVEASYEMPSIGTGYDGRGALARAAATMASLSHLLNEGHAIG